MNIQTVVSGKRNKISHISSIVAAVLLLPLAVAAQTVGSDVANPAYSTAPESGASQGVALQLGYNSKYRMASLLYQTPTLWSHQFENDWGRVDLDIELGVSYWEAKRGKSGSMGQISAIPMLRWWPTDDFYLELGSGPTMLSKSEFGGRDLGTRFQFGSHVGTGVLINQRHRLGIRFSHYSNARIKTPNPGLDLLGLAYTYQF